MMDFVNGFRMTSLIYDGTFRTFRFDCHGVRPLQVERRPVRLYGNLVGG